MKFYEIDSALQEAVRAADKPVRVHLEICMNGHFESVPNKDIIEANFYSLKEAAGGVSSRGDVTINNEQGKMNSGNAIVPGSEVRVFFSVGDGLSYFQRFTFYINDKGIQDIWGPGRKRFIRLDLRDLSAKLRKTDEARDWTSPAVFTYSVICDKTQPEKSLVHGIARRAGLTANDIDCSTIPVTLPFVRLRRNIWAELSSMATAYRCHLECAPEKPLVFAHSPYQTNEKGKENNEKSEEEDFYSYTFTGEDIFYLRKIEKAELYRNTVRLKINMPVSLEKQEIWRYDDPPVMYDDLFQAYYPFKSLIEREIEQPGFEGQYKVKGKSEKGEGLRPVVFADQIDTKEEAEERLQYLGGPFVYSQYDVTTHPDRALLKLTKTADGDLYRASIHGRPIVLDLNRSCFLRDSEGISNFGTAALNVTGSYFSEHEVEGKPHYEDWVSRELAERIQEKKEYTIKTHRALFNARVGANVKVKVKSEEVKGVVNALSFRYKRNAAFVSSFRITGTGGNNDQ
jgi:hypothetical protein